MVDLNGLTTLIYVDWIPQVNGPPEKSVRSDNWNQDLRCKSVRKVESMILILRTRSDSASPPSRQFFRNHFRLFEYGLGCEHLHVGWVAVLAQDSFDDYLEFCLDTFFYRPVY